MNDLERALREAPIPDEPAARARARATVLAAHEDVSPRPRTRASLIWVAAAALIAALVLTQRDSGPAKAFEKIVRQVVEQPKKPKPVATSSLALPTRGRMLITDGDSTWLVERNGKRRRLGSWQDATWSPQGLFIAVTEANTLAAIQPADGTVRWKLTGSRPVSLPRWAPGGRHIAYRSGDTLRIVYGNGLHDVQAGKQMAAVAPAWRPTDDHAVAWAATDGTVTVEDADTAKVLFTHKGAVVHQLAWSGDGRTLLIAGRRNGAIYDVATGRRTPLTTHDPIVAAAFGGTRLALAVSAGDQTNVTIDGATVLHSPGRLRDLQWSPDGHWLLTGWAGADHWLAIKTTGQARESAVSAVRHRFGAGERVRGWCC
jgi:hypothetical protein